MRICCIALLLITSAVQAGTPVLEQVASGLSSPLGVRHARDGSNRIFIVQQTGQVRILSGSSLLATPFVDISTIIRAGGERGLLGLAFHPQFSSNGRFYLNYTNLFGDTVIAQCTVAGNPDAVDCVPDNNADDGNVILLTIDQDFANHNGGDIHFGPDGYLYIGMGDGGSAGDPNNRSQDPRQLLGKMLRIDIDNPGANADQACGAAVHYGIPPDNPFIGADPADVCDEVHSIGLRNPFRFSFDRDTGELWIADVGQSMREEVNLEPGTSDDPILVFEDGFENPGGLNYGWDCREGSVSYSQSSPLCDLNPVLTDPVLEYSHSLGRCSVTGGYRYRGPVADYVGSYFFGDYCTGEIFRADVNGGTWSFDVMIDPDTDPSSYCPSGFCLSGFGEDEAGNLYVVDLGGGVFRLTVPSG